MASVAPDIARAKTIKGWMADVELRWLAQRATRAHVIVEVGSYQGRSTRALADHCPGVVFAVDPWSGVYIKDNGRQARWLDTAAALGAFQENLGDHIASGRVVPCVGTLESAIDAGLGLAVRADIVFLDGDHRYEEVLRDIQNAKRILKPGGLLCGHDFGKPSWPGVEKAVREVFGKSFRVQKSIWWAL